MPGAVAPRLGVGRLAGGNPCGNSPRTTIRISVKGRKVRVGVEGCLEAAPEDNAPAVGHGPRKPSDEREEPRGVSKVRESGA